MQEAFVAALQKQYPQINTSTPGLLAVSGGVDSMVLSHLMSLSGFPFAIAHCNFHLRPGDCDRDEQFVRQWALQFGAPCLVAQFDTHQYAAIHHLSIEEAARNLRYAFFQEMCDKYHYAYIATAHHYNDAEETFFINLLRGTGLGGLRGIPQVNGRIVRPLLAFSREQIEKYAEDHCINHVEDSTNAELRFLRNKVRHQLLPLLRSINPAFDQVMLRNMQHLDDAYQIVQDAVADQSNTLLHCVDGAVVLNIEEIRRLRPRSTWLFELLRPYGFQPSVVERLSEDLDAQSGKFFYSPTHRLLKDRSQLFITPLHEASSTSPLSNSPTPSIHATPMNRQSFDRHDPALGGSFIVVDADTISLPLRLRHWCDGDRFWPFGLGHSQLLSDYFTDHKFSLIDKEKVWLIEDAAGRIVWLVGSRSDHRFRVTEQTTRLLKITVADTSSSRQ